MGTKEDGTKSKHAAVHVRAVEIASRPCSLQERLEITINGHKRLMPAKPGLGR